jgi:hypothetical protein
MDRDTLNNTVSSLLVIGYILMTAWSNAWAMMIYSMLGLIACYFIFPTFDRKAKMVIALSGVVAFVVAFLSGLLMK